MALIYREATEVLIWLGPATKASDAAMDTFHKVGTEAAGFPFDDLDSSYDGESGLFGRLCLASTWEDEDPVDEQGQTMQGFLIKISGTDSSAGVGICQPSDVEDLLRWTWWSRVWVLQEFLMATTAVFICGYRKVPGREFIHAFDTLFGYSVYIGSKDTIHDPNFTSYEAFFVEPRPGNQALYLLGIRKLHKSELPSLMNLVGTLYANKRIR